MQEPRLVTGLLLAARLLPLVWLARAVLPGFTPAFALAGLVAALLPAALPLAPVVSPAGHSLLLPLLVELSRGALFALPLLLPLHAFAWAGRAAAATVDPPGTAVRGPLGQLYGLGACAVFCATSGHVALVGLLADGLGEVPLLSPPGALGPALLQSAKLLAPGLQLALQLASPVLLCALLLQASMGAALRVSPALASELAAGPLLLLAGLAAASLSLALVLPEVPTATRTFFTQAAELLRSSR